MAYLTPQELPEDDDCRPLLIPADSEWLALFGGALTELTKTYNWQYSGGLTIDETVEKMTEIINNWYASPCAMCVTPGGYRAVRIGSSGHLEQLSPSGDWEAATDEYFIPPPAAREGGSEADQICLAAKNATNVLSQTYESLSESWGESLSEAEALTAFVGVIVGVVGFAFAPITFGIYAFFSAVFSILYTALEYLGADLWDEAFDNQMTCFLRDCANNDAGVVTFDYDCFVDKLNSLANDFLLSETQMRLYLQVSYILWFIGGIDALNLAARTTEITDDDCSFCDLQLDLIPSTVDPAPGTIIEYLGDGWWAITGYNSGSDFRAGFKDSHGYCINIDVIASANNAFHSRYNCAMMFDIGGGVLGTGDYNYYCGTRILADGNVYFEFHAFASEP